jgi:hypothetical protein
MKTHVIGGKWIDDLNADLRGSDRACAVLAGAILDDRLANLITIYLLPPNKKGEDKLLGRGGIIESFSARIELGQRLNLISEKLAKALDWIREIRNEAAHNPEFSFAGDSVRSKVQNVVAALGLRERAAPLLEPPYAETKGHFVASVVMLVGFLEVECNETARTSHQPTNVLENFHLKNG